MFRNDEARKVELDDMKQKLGLNNQKIKNAEERYQQALQEAMSGKDTIARLRFLLVTYCMSGLEKPGFRVTYCTILTVSL